MDQHSAAPSLCTHRKRLPLEFLDVLLTAGLLYVSPIALNAEDCFTVFTQTEGRRKDDQILRVKWTCPKRCGVKMITMNWAHRRTGSEFAFREIFAREFAK